MRKIFFNKSAHVMHSLAHSPTAHFRSFIYTQTNQSQVSLLYFFFCTNTAYSESSYRCDAENMAEYFKNILLIFWNSFLRFSESDVGKNFYFSIITKLIKIYEISIKLFVTTDFIRQILKCSFQIFLLI